MLKKCQNMLKKCQKNVKSASKHVTEMTTNVKSGSKNVKDMSKIVKEMKKCRENVNSGSRRTRFSVTLRLPWVYHRTITMEGFVLAYSYNTVVRHLKLPRITSSWDTLNERSLLATATTVALRGVDMTQPLPPTHENVRIDFGQILSCSGYSKASSELGIAF